jgi:hypothetical protein
MEIKSLNNKVLVTSRCRRQNFRPSVLRLVNNCVQYSLSTRRKRLGRKFCLLQRLVNSTLAIKQQIFKNEKSHVKKCQQIGSYHGFYGQTEVWVSHLLYSCDHKTPVHALPSIFLEIKIIIN